MHRAPFSLAAGFTVRSTNYTVTGLSAGTWYFGVEAFTTDGGVSQLSEIVSKKIP